MRFFCTNFWGETPISWVNKRVKVLVAKLMCDANSVFDRFLEVLDSIKFMVSSILWSSEIIFQLFSGWEKVSYLGLIVKLNG